MAHDTATHGGQVMTVAELIRKLESLPQGAQVMVVAWNSAGDYADDDVCNVRIDDDGTVVIAGEAA